MSIDSVATVANIPQDAGSEDDARGVVINMRIPEELHRQVKTKASSLGLKLREFVIQSLQESVKDAA